MLLQIPAVLTAEQVAHCRARLDQAEWQKCLAKNALGSVYDPRVVTVVRHFIQHIHETLDQRQRKILAEIVESGPFGRGFGRFR